MVHSSQDEDTSDTGWPPSVRFNHLPDWEAGEASVVGIGAVRSSGCLLVGFRGKGAGGGGFLSFLP